VGVFLATSESALSQDGIQARTLEVSPLGPNGSVNLSVPLTIPTADPGALYVIAELDAATAVGPWTTIIASAGPAGSSASKPRKAVKLRVGLPDLVVSGLSVTPTEGMTGTRITANLTVQNAGNASSGSSSLAFHLALSADASVSGTTPLVTIAVPALPAGAATRLTATLTLPAIEADAYQLVAVVDPAATLVESIETNNRTATGLAVVDSTSQLTLWVVDNLTRVQPTGPPGTQTTAEIKAARNEYEAFQIVIRAPDDRALSNVNVVASDLVGPGIIPAAKVALYRQHYVEVKTPSPNSPYPVGWWPDALVPFVNPETGQPLAGALPSAPFDVSPGRNQPIWVEVHVTEGTPAGNYHGTLLVTASETVSRPVPVTVTVWPFTLPKRTTLRSTFGALWDVARRHNVSFGSEAYKRIARRYYESLLAHRVNPAQPEDTLPRVTADGTVDTSTSHAAMAYYMDTLGANTWQLPLGPGLGSDLLGSDRPAALRYLRSLHTYLVQHGWSDRAYIAMVDEPETLEHYDWVRNYADLVHEAHPELKFLVTEQPTPDQSSFGTLYGSVDIWVPAFRNFNLDDIRARQHLGEEAWSYTCLWQCDDCPTWLLDYPLIDYRITPWISWALRLSGLLYWTTTYWPNDPWVTPVGWYYAGDGILFYPGSAVGYDGPVASMRLKALRDGMEDYEYLQLLRTLTDQDTSDEIARTMAVDYSNWNGNIAQLVQARERLAGILSTLVGR
jgi:hypothetical protein